MFASISQATTLPSSFADDIAAVADGGWTSAEVWLTKLERHLETSSVKDTQDLLEGRDVRLAAAAYQGGLLLSQGEARQTTCDHYKSRLELCQTFGIRTLVVVADFVQGIDSTAISRAIVSLAQAAQWAAAFDVRLALEFRGTGTFCTSLDTAIALVEQCGQPNLGICLDIFHFHQGPSKETDLKKLTKANLAHVQFCDVAGVPRELMTDADRVFPGEGDFALEPILARLDTIGYDGAVSLELMNPVLWKLKPSQVAELGLAAMRRYLNN